MKNQIRVSKFAKMDWKKCFVIFLLIWLIVNSIQAIFTEIMSDEAYYFLYGKNLAWGYFDHPPMVGLMTFFSDLFFNGNLSVRFVTLIFQAFTLIFIWKIIADKSPDTSKVGLFFIISASFVMFQVYGFVTTPDAPLLFFTALFLLFYKCFLSKETWINTFLLGISMAGMTYSKYHAMLIVGFILLSNWRLLFRYKFWLAGLTAVLLLIPHCYWQIANDFPGIKYHLSDRNSLFKWGYFFEFIPNQLAVFNPFTFGAVVYIFIKYKPSDLFEKGLYYLTAGFIAFFWLSSFRGHVEPHWTVACSIPMIVLLYRRSLENQKLRRYVKRIVAASILLILIARGLLLAGLLPEKLDFNGKRTRNKALEIVAGDLPVVFTGSFQNPSNYRFFTGKESFLLSSVDSRQTQFDIWQKESDYQGKPVFVATQNHERAIEYLINGKSVYGYSTGNFQSVNRLKIDYDLKNKELCAGDSLILPFTLQNPTSFDIDFEHPEFPVKWCVAYAKNVRRSPWTFIDCQLEFPLSRLSANATIRGNLTMIVPDLETGEYQFTATLVNPICAARNSSIALIKINKK